MVETKGDDRDNTDSKDKLILGNYWFNYSNQITVQTGYRYHYFMVFENNPIEGAYRIGDILKLIENL